MNYGEGGSACPPGRCYCGDCHAEEWERRKLIAAGYFKCMGGCGRLLPPTHNGDECEACAPFDMVKYANGLLARMGGR